MSQDYFYYKAFGLTFKSCIEHPEFMACTETVDPDCAINFGDVPDRLINPTKVGAVYQTRDKTFLLQIKRVGRYLVEKGNSITIDKADSATDREIIIFLWASAVAALLHQRGLMILHGSAVKIGGGAVIFSGPSGSGKSTMVSAFTHTKGAFMISDDISAISITNTGIPVVLPGYPMMKLWRDSSEKFGIEWDETRFIRHNVKKMVVNTSNRFTNEEVPLKQAYILSYKNEGAVEIEEVNGYKKLELLTGKIFKKSYIKNLSTQPNIFESASIILPLIRLCTIKRQHGMQHLDTTINMIESDMTHSGIW